MKFITTLVRAVHPSSFGHHTSVDMVASAVYLASLFFAPLLALGLSDVSFSSAVVLIVSCGVSIAGLLWFVARFLEGRMIVPQSLSMGIAIIALIFVAISTLVSPDSYFVFGSWQMGWESSLFLISALSVTFVGGLLSFSFRLGGTSIALLSGGVVLAVVLPAVQILGVSLPSATSFASVTQSFIGGWGDLAYGAVFVASGALGYLIVGVSARRTWSVYGVLIVALFILVAINSYTAWVVMGATSLFFMVVALFVLPRINEHFMRARTFVMHPAVVLVFVCSLVFLMAGSFIGSPAGERLGMYTSELRPSTTATSQVALHVLKEGNITGVGPGGFSQAWSSYYNEHFPDSLGAQRPFSHGVSFLATLFVTLGVLGGIAFLAFLVSVGKDVFRGRKIFSDVSFLRETSLVSLVGMSFAGALFFSIGISGVFILYVIFALFGMTSATILAGSGHVKRVSFRSGSREGVIALVVFLVCVFIFLGLSLMSLRQHAALKGQNEARQSFVRGEHTRALALFHRSGSLAPSVYGIHANTARFIGSELLRTLEALSINPSQEIQTDVLENYVVLGIASARRAHDLRPESAEPLIVLAELYRIVGQLGVSGAYEQSRETYHRALSVHANLPHAHIGLAHLYGVDGDRTQMRDHISHALSLTDDAHMYMQAGMTEERFGSPSLASEHVREALRRVAPHQPGVFFDAGMFSYRLGNRQEALDRFIQAKERVPLNLMIRGVVLRVAYEIGDTDSVQREVGELESLYGLSADLDRVIDSILEEAFSESESVSYENVLSESDITTQDEDDDSVLDESDESQDE